MRRLKKLALYLAITYAAFFLQTVLMPHVSIAGVSPNLLVIAVAVIGFMVETKDGIFLGLLCGICCDRFFGDYFGIYAFIYALVGYTAGFMHQKIFDDDVSLPVVAIGICDVIYGLLMYVLYFLLRSRYDFVYYLFHVIIPEAVYTAVIGAAVYYLFLAVYRRQSELAKRSADKFV